MNANMQVGEIFVTINLLDYKDDDIPHAKKGKELGYVESVSVTYALNEIPTANVVVPLGSALHQDGSTSPSYVYGGSEDSLYKIGDDSTPVGIYVRGAFFDTTGASTVQEFCILKGYITDSNYERSSGSASMTIKMIHWLCHLTEFPLVSPLLAPQTSADIAAQYPLSVSDKEAANMKGESMTGGRFSFEPAGMAADVLETSDGAGIWDALKALFVGLSPNLSRLAEDDPGYVSKKYLERVDGSLAAVVGSDLDFFPNVQEDYNEIKQAIAVMLASLSCGYFNGSTIWDKLVNTFLPGFYMALTPRVCEANIIPAPGQCMGIAKVKNISKSEYYQTSYSRMSMPTLFGGVMLYLDPNVYMDMDTPKCSIRFPEELQPGPLRVVTAPSWLTKELVAMSGANIISDWGFYEQYRIDFEKRKEETKKQEKVKVERRNTVERILNNLVRITYQILACSGRQISVVMPLRMDLTAGEVVCIEIPGGVVESTQEYIYGTIDSVTLNIGTNTANTSIVLSNIRTQKEMKNKDLTSSEGIMYTKSWKSNSNLILCERVI